MTKSIIKQGNSMIIELYKGGIEAIKINGEIKIGEFDGVDFIEKHVSEEKMARAKSYVEKILDAMSSCPCIISIVFSDMIYTKFTYKGKEIVAFISKCVTYNKQISVDKDTENRIVNCSKKFLDALSLKQIDEEK
jgi:menaquinone-dependent protoporphyrinogen IX oxidase